MIKFKGRIILKQTKHCILATADGADNNHANSNNITFVIKDTKSYIVILSAKDNQKLSKLVSKGF